MFKLTQEAVKQYLRYNADGTLTWRDAAKTKYHIPGSVIAPTRDKDGYPVVFIEGRQYKVHRLVFLYHNGFLPKCIDHINGLRADNRIENLRAATFAQNQFNRLRTSTRPNKFKGVYPVKNSSRFSAHITFQRKQIYLGQFDSELQAARAYDRKARELYGEFARPNCQDDEK